MRLIFHRQGKQVHKLQPLKPWPFQHEAIDIGVDRDYLLCLPCGLGKTLIAIETGIEVRRRITQSRILVVIHPKVAGEQWRAAIRRQDPDAQIEVWTNKTRYTDLDLDNPIWIIINYDMLPKLINVLDKYQWAVVISDEAHKVKNKDAKRTIALKRIQAHRRIAMTATPIERSAADLWSLLNWLKPKQYTSYWRFFNKYVLTEQGYGGYDVIVGTKPHMVHELADELRPVLFRRNETEVAPDMPPLIEQHVPIELNRDQRTIYDKIRKAKDIEVDLGGAEPELIQEGMDRFTWMHQVASDPHAVGLKQSSAKVEWVQAYVEDNPDQQMIIFSRYREVAKRMARDLGAALVLGGQDAYRIDEFIDGRMRIMCGTIGAMGTALDLPMARTCIFMDQEWSTILMEQAMKRVHRLGITESKHVIFLEAERTVDQKIKKALLNKWTDKQLLYATMQEDDDG